MANPYTEDNPATQNPSNWKSIESDESGTTLPLDAIATRPDQSNPSNANLTDVLEGLRLLAQDPGGDQKVKDAEETMEVEAIRLLVIALKDKRDLAARAREVDGQANLEGQDGEELDLMEKAAWGAMRGTRKIIERRRMWQPEDWERRKRLRDALITMKNNGEIEEMSGMEETDWTADMSESSGMREDEEEEEEDMGQDDEEEDMGEDDEEENMEESERMGGRIL